MSFADGSRVVDDRAVRFTVRPPNVSVQPGGDFRVTLVSAPDPAGYGQFPLLILEHADYEPVGIDLQRQGASSRWKRLVVLRDTLALQPLPRIAEREEP